MGFHGNPIIFPGNYTCQPTNPDGWLIMLIVVLTLKKDIHMNYNSLILMGFPSSKDPRVQRSILGFPQIVGT